MRSYPISTQQKNNKPLTHSSKHYCLILVIQMSMCIYILNHNSAFLKKIIVAILMMINEHSYFFHYFRL